MGFRSQYLGIRSQNLGLTLRGQNDRTLTKIQVFLPDLDHFAWLWAILLGYGRYSLDLGPKGDKTLRMKQGGMDGCTYRRTLDVRTDVCMDGHTDGQIPPVFYRTLSPLGPLPKKRGRDSVWM